MNDELYQKLTTSRKYRWVCPSTVRRVLEECEGRYKKPRDLEKAVRERLHGVTSAFMTDAEFKSALALARAGDWESLLSLHASTRERLPLARMDAAYVEIFAHTGAPGSVLDLAGRRAAPARSGAILCDLLPHPDAGRTGRGHGAALFRMDGGPSARGPRRRRAHRR